MGGPLVMNNRFFIYTLCLVFIVSLLGSLFLMGVVVMFAWVIGLSFGLICKKVTDQFKNIDKKVGEENGRVVFKREE